MTMHISFIILISIVVCFACKNNNVQSPRPVNIEFKRDIPSDGMGKKSLFASLAFVRDSLKLDTLENGYDSLEIRLWIRHYFTLKHQLVVIKNHDGAWHAYYYEFEPILNELRDSLFYYKKNKTEKKPKVTWQEFTGNLFRLKIDTLPDSEKLKDYYPPANTSSSLSIEYSTKNIYRLYEYSVPSLFINQFPEAKNVSAILKYVTDQFNIKLLGEL